MERSRWLDNYRSSSLGSLRGSDEKLEVLETSKKVKATICRTAPLKLFLGNSYNSRCYLSLSKQLLSSGVWSIERLDSVRFHTHTITGKR